ncbi:MAG: DUF5916 domain-containing protein [Gemmatimonadaceae bacterium]
MLPVPLAARVALVTFAMAMAGAPSHASPQAAPDSSAHPRAYRTKEAIRLDGTLDEADWARADSITDFRQKEPTEGGPPSVRTVVRLLATPNGLAIGWWCYDHDPATIRRTQLRRDAALRSDDYVSMMIDGLSDRRSAFYFRTNSNGAMWDGEHIDNENGNEEWDGIWDARTQITAEGWTAEMLIPWATLRYPKDVQSMGMLFRRFLPRTNEEILWRAWRRTEGLRFLEREGAIDGLDHLPPRAIAEFRPYVLGEARPPERFFRGDGSDSVTAEALQRGDMGLDVKVPVTATLTADLTFRPDFAQSEVDRQIVNLTRFPLFFPERRTFFTEGAATFSFGREQQTQMFYSRRIGLGSGGTPVTIPAGARMQGRVGKYVVGLLAAATSGNEDARDFVARARRDVFKRGYVGAIATLSDRPARPGSLAGGLDYNLPFVVNGNNLIFMGNAAWSRDSTGATPGAHYRFVIDYPNDRADIVTRFDRVEAGYNPALGFVQQRGIYRWGGSTSIQPRPRHSRLVRKFDFNFLNYDVVWRDGSGSTGVRAMDNANFSVRPLGIQFQSGDRVELNAIRRFDAPDVDFEIAPGIAVPAGGYWWNRAEVKYTGSNVRTWAIEATASTGAFYDGNRNDLSFVGKLRQQPHLEFSLEYERNDISLPAGAFVANTIRFRGDYAVSPRLTFTAFAQADDRSDRAALNARMRWTQSPGSDLFIVWNSVWPTLFERSFDLMKPQNGGLVVKYVRFFRK